MKTIGFLMTLEGFPGREELKRGNLNSFYWQYYNVVFKKISEIFNQNKASIAIPKNEEIWFKFLSFLQIATVVLSEDRLMKENLETLILHAETYLVPESRNVAREICETFNWKFHGGMQIIQGIGGITFEELVQFAKSEEPLFF